MYAVLPGHPAEHSQAGTASTRGEAALAKRNDPALAWQKILYETRTSLTAGPSSCMSGGGTRAQFLT